MIDVDYMDFVEKQLCKVFNKKFCCFTGNATTAIYLTLKALNLQNKNVLYPAITCTNPVNSAIYAGYNVFFSDIDLQDYTIDIENLESIIKDYNIGVIVPTHIYGHRVDIHKISNICKKHRVFILEDAAQSTYFDNFSDASVISFGHTKIFENINGGGAVFTNNKELFSKIKLLKSELNKIPLNINELFERYRKNYYSIVNSKLCYEEKNKKIYELQIESKKIFLFDNNATKEVLQCLKYKNQIISERQNKSLLYEKYLESQYIIKPKVDFKRSIPWRYSFLFKKDRNKLLNLIRKKNIDISSWYPSLDTIYKNDTKELINAKYLEDQIVNLWVDYTHTEQQIKDEIKIINQTMKEV